MQDKGEFSIVMHCVRCTIPPQTWGGIVQHLHVCQLLRIHPAREGGILHCHALCLLYNAPSNHRGYSTTKKCKKGVYSTIAKKVTRKFLDWKFLFESSQTKIAWKLIPWPENCWLRKFRDCNFLACKFLDPKIPCTENSLKAPWDENSLTRAKGYNWLPRAATVPERIALKISNI